MRKKWGIRQGIVSAAVFGAVVVAVSVDSRVRERLAIWFRRPWCVSVGRSRRRFAGALTSALRYHPLENAPLLSLLLPARCSAFMLKRNRTLLSLDPDRSLRPTPAALKNHVPLILRSS